MKQICRVCNKPFKEPVYSGSAPSVLSTSSLIDIPLNVYVCSNCGHTQSDEIPDLQNFYDKTYRISMSSGDHDQLYEIINGKDVFRTDKQADMVLSLIDLPKNANILDFGAAKANTLRKIYEKRSDLIPHVFDVSKEYEDSWSDWLDSNNCSTYNIPENWSEKFDCVTSHFVLEHVSDPRSMLSDIRKLTKQGGHLFLSVPNIFTNSGDFLVADHINHFSRSSLQLILNMSGFRILKVDETIFTGAFVVTAIADETASDLTTGSSILEAEILKLQTIVDFWTGLSSKIDQIIETYKDKPTAIYGAGFYGSLIYSKLINHMEIDCFIDRNPHVAGTNHFTKPVISPDSLDPNITTVIAGLNPSIAREILSDVSEWSNRNIEVIFLD